MLLFKVSYRVRAHHMSSFEELFRERILPLIDEHNLRFLGIWRTLVGNAGEYLELWHFQSMADFEGSWRGLMNDPRLQEIFQKTGPMVEDENFTLFEPALDAPGPADDLLQV